MNSGRRWAATRTLPSLDRAARDALSQGTPLYRGNRGNCDLHHTSNRPAEVRLTDKEALMGLCCGSDFGIVLARVDRFDPGDGGVADDLVVLELVNQGDVGPGDVFEDVGKA